MRLTELRGQSVAVWGLRQEGRAALDALDGVPVRSLIAVDDQPAQYTTPSGASFTAVAGTAGELALREADVVLKSPGISRYTPLAVDLTARGVRLTSGSALWMAAHHRRTIGVTGSKGKSTTSSLISHLLTGLGIANEFGGNIGTPLLSLPESDNYVVELSSYQCSDLEHSPRISALTSLFPEHLNWHGTEERYFADKLNIVAHGPDHVVYNARDERLSSTLPGLVEPNRLLAVGTSGGFHLRTGADGPEFARGDQALFPRSASALLGDHNAANVCVALGVLSAMDVDCVARRGDIEAALRAFVALPHRLTAIHDPGGLTFIDDSLSTAPQATIAALEAFPTGAICIIVGGEDRGVSYVNLREYLATQAREVVAIGIPQSGPRIIEALAGLPHVSGLSAPDLDAAVALARAHLPRPATVLLSPGAPSYGSYRNFEDRAAAFATAITRTAP